MTHQEELRKMIAEFAQRVIVQTFQGIATGRSAVDKADVFKLGLDFEKQVMGWHEAYTNAKVEELAERIKKAITDYPTYIHESTSFKSGLLSDVDEALERVKQ